MLSIEIKCLAGIEQDTKTHSSVDGNFSSHFKVVVGDDAFSYSSKGGRSPVDPLIHFCISCAVCREDTSEVDKVVPVRNSASLISMTGPTAGHAPVHWNIARVLFVSLIRAKYRCRHWAHKATGDGTGFKSAKLRPQNMHRRR